MDKPGESRPPPRLVERSPKGLVWTSEISKKKKHVSFVNCRHHHSHLKDVFCRKITKRKRYR